MNLCCQKGLYSLREVIPGMSILKHSMEPGSVRVFPALLCTCGYELYKRLGLQSFPRWRISNCQKKSAEVQAPVVIRSPGWVNSPWLSSEGSLPCVLLGWAYLRYLGLSQRTRHRCSQGMTCWQTKHKIQGKRWPFHWCWFVCMRCIPQNAHGAATGWPHSARRCSFAVEPPAELPDSCVIPHVCVFCSSGFWKFKFILCIQALYSDLNLSPFLAN